LLATKNIERNYLSFVFSYVNICLHNKILRHLIVKYRVLGSGFLKRQTAFESTARIINEKSKSRKKEDFFKSFLFGPVKPV